MDPRGMIQLWNDDHIDKYTMYKFDENWKKMIQLRFILKDLMDPWGGVNFPPWGMIQPWNDNLLGIQVVWVIFTSNVTSKCAYV